MQPDADQYLDVLNRFYPAYSKTKSEIHVYDPRQQAAHARHLSKYVFPGQYGLPTPFQSLGKKEVFPYPDHFDREGDIKARDSAPTSPFADFNGTNSIWELARPLNASKRH